MSVAEETVTNIMRIARDKNTRNVLFLIISILAVLAINSLLPVIEGSAHYTEAIEEMTYAEYQEKVSANPNYNLTWASNKEIDKYIDAYAEENEIPLSQKYNIIPPDNFKVKVYTKFFFKHPYWWVSTATHVVSVLLIYYSVFNYILSKRKQKYDRYLSLLKEVDSATTNKLDPITFEPWMINVFNRNRKIAQHKANIKYKLDLLNKHTSYTVRNADPTDKRRIKYETKKKNLEEQLTDEYINKYITGKKVKGFVYIHPTFVTSGYNVIGVSTDSYSLLNSDASRLSKDSFKKIAMSVLITTMFAILLTFTVGSSADQPWYWILINIITKIAPMSLQIPAAYDYCDSFMDNHLITNLISRRNIALLYLADMNKHREVNTNET